MYFGITNQPVLRRWNNGRGYDGCPLFHRAIEKYGWDGFSHIIIMEGLSKSFACFCERYFIRIFDTTNPLKGYNCDNGGMGVGSRSDQTKEKLRVANTGRRYSEETRQKHRDAMKKRGFSFNDAARNNSRCSRIVSICQYDKDKNLVQTWDSIAEAANTLGLSHQNISRCLIGKSHTCGGFYWSYLDKQIVEPKSNTSIILKVDPVNEQVIASFQSLNEAERSTGIPKGNICAAYKGRRHTAGGFIWKRVNLLANE